MRIQVDKIMTENYRLKIGNKHFKTEVDNLKALLAAAEQRQKLAEETTSCFR